MEVLVSDRQGRTAFRVLAVLCAEEFRPQLSQQSFSGGDWICSGQASLAREIANGAGLSTFAEGKN
jgi:hypothetical protein